MRCPCLSDFHQDSLAYRVECFLLNYARDLCVAGVEPALLGETPRLFLLITHILFIFLIVRHQTHLAVRDI